MFNALSRKKISLPAETQSLMLTLAGRIATELERELMIRQLEASEVKYKTIYESTKDAMMTLSAGEKFLSGNPSTIRMFKCKDEAHFVSKTPADLSPIYQPDGELSEVKAQKMMEKTIEQGSFSFEWMHKRMDESEFPAFVTLTKMVINGEVFLEATIHDITEQKVSELKIMEAAEIRSKFMAMASHELRTPLTVIKMGVDLIGGFFRGNGSDEQKEIIDQVRRNIDRLIRLTTDVLDLEKIKAGKMIFNCKPNSINEVVNEVYQTMQLQAEKKRLSLSLSLDETVPEFTFDKDKIIQVLINVINNSIKFITDGGINIQTLKVKNSVKVAIKDTGPGIKKEDIKKLFKAFSRIEGMDYKKAEGTGLGLSISKEIIDGHKGRIWEESEFGKGTDIYFVLPFTPDH